MRQPTEGAPRKASNLAYPYAWFIGFTPEVVTGVWVGFDTPEQILRNAYATTLAVPAWTRFMKAAFPKPRSAAFAIPPGIVQEEICSLSGQLATPACRVTMQPVQLDSSLPVAEPGSEPERSTYMEYFASTRLPQSCQIHSGITAVSPQELTSGGWIFYP